MENDKGTVENDEFSKFRRNSASHTSVMKEVTTKTLKDLKNMAQIKRRNIGNDENDGSGTETGSGEKEANQAVNNNKNNINEVEKKKNLRLLASGIIPEGSVAQEVKLDGQEEEFENNESESILSPSTKSPELPKGKVAQIIYHCQGAPAHFILRSNWQRYGVIFASAFGFPSLFQVPRLCVKYGMGTFFFMYIIILTFVGVPLAFAELSIGQYASMPPLQLFSRRTPLWKGLGILLTMIRVVNSFLNFDDMFAMNFISSVMILVNQNFLYTNCRNPSTFINCYDRLLTCPDTPNATYVQYLGECFPVLFHIPNKEFIETVTNKNFTKSELILLMSSTHSALRETPFETFIAQDLSNTPNALVCGAAFIFLSPILLVAMKGMKSFGILCLISSVMTFGVLISCLVLDIYSEDYYRLISEFFIFKWDAFNDLAFYMDVMSMVFLCNAIGDGTLILIGSFTKFNNNVLRDVGFLYCSSIISLVLSTSSMIPMFAKFALNKYPEDGIFENIAVRLELLAGYSRAEFHWQFLDLVARTWEGAIFTGIFCLTFSIMQICPQIITAELIFQTVINSSRQFVHVNITTAVNTFYCFFVLFAFLITILHDWFRGRQDFMDFLQNLNEYCVVPAGIMIQSFLIFYPYSVKRHQTNIHSMMGRKNRTGKFWMFFGWLDPTGKFWAFSWHFILPLTTTVFFICCQYGMITGPLKHDDERDNTFALIFLRSVVYILTLFIVLGTVPAVAISELRKVNQMGKNVWSLLEPEPIWGPLMYGDRQKAEFDERANRVRS